MHRVTATVGVAFAMVYIAAFASLSEITTVPAAKLLPGFTVVAENAEYVPIPATVPITPTTQERQERFPPPARAMDPAHADPSRSTWCLSVPPRGFGRVACATRPTPAEAIYWFCASHVKSWSPDVRPAAAALFCSVSVNR